MCEVQINNDSESINVINLTPILLEHPRCLDQFGLAEAFEVPAARSSAALRGVGIYKVRADILIVCPVCFVTPNVEICVELKLSAMVVLWHSSVPFTRTHTLLCGIALPHCALTFS